MAKVDDMGLNFNEASLGVWRVLTVSGELDMHTSPALQDRLDSLSGPEVARNIAPKIAVDLSAVPFMDSSSLGVLVVSNKGLQERGGRLALVGVDGSPKKVLSITGIDKVIPVYGSESELPQE